MDDGTLDDAAIQWVSDLDGPLGTGASLAVNMLHPGRHQIFMTATASDGTTATKLVNIRVVAAVPSLSLSLSSVAGSGGSMQAVINATPGSVDLATVDYSLEHGATIESSKFGR